VICPQCNTQESKVLESRVIENGVVIRRRRECLNCAFRFTTYERIESANLLVVKKDGTRELFDRAKLSGGIYKAFQKRPTSAAQIESLISSIENELKGKGESEIASDEIGELIMEKIRHVDDVAYVRFASVYRSFADIQSFEEVLNSLKNKS